MTITGATCAPTRKVPQMTSAAVKMSNGTTLLAATGTFARRDGARQIEAPDMSGINAAVPEGWTLLHVRSV